MGSLAGIYSGNVVIFPTDLSLTGSEFHRFGATAEKAVVPTFVLTLGTKSRLDLDNQSCLGCLAGVSSECICADISWKHSLKFGYG